MTLIKYNPNRFYPNTFNSFVDRFFNDDFFGNGTTNTAKKAFSPQVDIAETDKQFEIQFAIPGLTKEDIKIDVDGDRLTVSGERKFENEKKEKNFHSVESYYGTFKRSFYLPENANVENIDASYTNGILEVVIPKDEKKENKRLISVK
jgi:HSP20 family protein